MQVPPSSSKTGAQRKSARVARSSKAQTVPAKGDDLGGTSLDAEQVVEPTNEVDTKSPENPGTSFKEELQVRLYILPILCCNIA